MKVLMVERAACFSPNSVQRDRCILEQTAHELEIQGHLAYYCNEEEIDQSLSPDLILSMARSQEALSVLAKMEAQGICVLNSPSGLQRLTRRKLLVTAQELGVLVPPFAIGDKSTKHPPLPYPFWWKRDDRSSQTAEDVLFVQSDDDWQKAMNQRAEAFVVESHLAGDLVKFYSVMGSDFIHINAPQFSKFGKEAINGHAQGFEVNLAQLKLQADKLAEAAGIHIYGGDAVVDCQGNARIIDFNDWPSYSSCYEAAAKAIAEVAITKTNKTKKD